MNRPSRNGSTDSVEWTPNGCPSRYTSELEMAMQNIARKTLECDATIKEMTNAFEKQLKLVTSESNKRKQEVFVKLCLPDVCPVETEVETEIQMVKFEFGTFPIDNIKIVVDIRKILGTNNGSAGMGNFYAECVGWRGRGMNAKIELTIRPSKEDKERMKQVKGCEYDWKLQTKEIHPGVWIIDPVYLKPGCIYFLTEFSRFRVDESVEEFKDYFERDHW